MHRSDDPPRATCAPLALDSASSELLGDFLRRHRNQLSRGIALHSGLRPQDRDEVLSDTMLGLCKVQRTLDPTRSPFSLAYTIALRKARTKLKQVGAARSRMETNHRSEDLQDHRHSGETQVEADERQHAVRRFLKGLNRTDRRIVEARHFDELTWDRIVVLVRLPKTSVIRRYRAIITEARRALADWNC